MLISRKRFEKEVEKRVGRERRILRLETENRQQAKNIEKMKTKIYWLQQAMNDFGEDLRAIKNRGSVKGYYQGADGGTVFCTKQQDTGDKSTPTE